MPEVAIAHVAGTIVTVPEVSGRHDAKGANRGQRPTLGSSQPVFTTARVADHFAVTTARQVEAIREDFARVGATVARIAIALGPSGVLTIAMVCAVTGVVPIIVALTFVMGFGRRTRAVLERQPVVIAISVALVPIAVTWVAFVAVVAWIEIHDISAELDAAVLASNAGLRRMCA